MNTPFLLLIASAVEHRNCNMEWCFLHAYHYLDVIFYSTKFDSKTAFFMLLPITSSIGLNYIQAN